MKTPKLAMASPDFSELASENRPGSARDVADRTRKLPPKKRKLIKNFKNKIFSPIFPRSGKLRKERQNRSFWLQKK